MAREAAMGMTYVQKAVEMACGRLGISRAPVLLNRKESGITVNYENTRSLFQDS